MCLSLLDQTLHFKMENKEIPFIEDLGKAFLPKRFKPHLSRYLSSAGVYKSPYYYLGTLFYVTLAITLLIMFLLIYPKIIEFSAAKFSHNVGSMMVGILVFFGWLIIQLVLYVVLFLLSYFFLDLKIYRRVNEIEAMLPEYLTLVSTNLKGGIGLEASLWGSIKPKFGVLSHEMTLVSKEVMTGSDVEEALAHFGEKYKSAEIRRIIGLIISEFEIGGRISDILDDVITHLKNTRKLRQQMAASVISYVIFISMIVGVIAPILFALSYNLLSFVSAFVAQVGASMSSGNAPSFMAGMSLEGVDPSGFKIFGYIATGTIAFISSVIVSIIERGDIKGGVKYIPIYLIVSLLVYHVSLTFLGSILGGL